MIAALMLRTFGLSDLGWQLRLGELMYAQGTVWVPDRFAAAHLGEPIVPNAWLAQMFYALVRIWSGWTGLRALDAVFWISGLLLATVPAARRGERPLALLLALLVGFVVALPTASIRPQSFAAPLFAAALLLAASGMPLRRTLAFGLPIFVLWQNLHPSVVLAALVLSATTAVQWLYDRRHGERRYRTLGALAGAAGIATITTPAGIRIFEFSAYNAQASLLIHATEWMPLWDPINREFLIPVLASSLLAAFIAWRHRAKLHPIEWVAPALCLVLSIGAARFILFYAIAIIPLIARARIGSQISVQAERKLLLVGLALSAVASTVALWCMPLRIEPEAPLAAVARLQRIAPTGTVYCDPAFGGTLIDRGNGQWTVSFDGRFYVYSLKELEQLNRTADAQANLPEIEAAYRPVAFMLAKIRSPGLISALRQDESNWREVYDDETAVVFVRAAGVNRSTAS